jgi:hypothetical protein
MSADIPSPWEQSLPRCVGLPPDGLLVPAGTLRALLAGREGIDLAYTGFALEPALGHGARFRVDRGRRPRRGDLLLCDIGGWADVRRGLRPLSGGGWLTALDALPSGREALAGEHILGVARPAGPAPSLARSIPFPLWSRFAAGVHWWRRIEQAPAFGARAVDSVREKYAQQVESYTAMLVYPMGEQVAGLIRANVPPGGSVLIAGSGAGGEAIHLARWGHRVVGFDFVPAMVDAARRNARAAGLEIEFLEADMAHLDLPGRRFDGVYVTPLVYSFQPGRRRRIECLRRLGRHLTDRGCVLYSVRRLRGLGRRLQVGLAWWRRRAAGGAGQMGDWYTWFLTPQGRIGKSFIHLHSARRVRWEARRAGFRSLERGPASHYIARDFRG